MKPRLLLALAVAFCVDAGAQERFTPLRASPAPPSAAPALPFRYVGQLSQNGRLEVLLMRGAELHSVAAGDTVDGEYRVDTASGAELALTHLRSGYRQVMQITPPIKEDGRVARTRILELERPAAPARVE